MKNSWQNCKDILCIRPDNLGDLVMTGPALRALKESFDCRITVLTSSMAEGIARLMPEIDDVIVFDAPWVKTNQSTDIDTFNLTVNLLREKQFDAAVIFTVYSQNPLPTVMLAYLVGIPLRLAYCRENPYHLLTHWIPDKEPYTLIKHQVRRDLDLVASVGAVAADEHFKLRLNEEIRAKLPQTLLAIGIDVKERWIIFHPGVSEPKRAYPTERWIAAGKKLLEEGYQIVLTGTSAEYELCKSIQAGLGVKCVDAAGMFHLEAFVNLISLAPVVVSVNTGTVHIAAAVATPVVVLYALTNPQHTPWMVPNRVLTYPVATEAQSRNEVIRHVQQFMDESIALPEAEDIACAVHELLSSDRQTTDPVIIGAPRHIPV